MDRAGASVIAWLGDTTISGCRSAHEYGHNLGLPHDLGEYDHYGSTLRGFMQYDGGSCVPVLGPRDFSEQTKWDIADEIVKDPSYHPYQAWANFASDKSFPRWDGYDYVGCYGKSCPLDYACESFYGGGFVCW